jgi:hypothetical protein
MQKAIEFSDLSLRVHSSEEPARRMPGGNLNIFDTYEIASLITFTRKDITTHSHSPGFPVGLCCQQR